MAISYPYMSDILTSSATTPTAPSPAAMLISTTGSMNTLMTFADANFYVSPCQWDPIEMEYDYTTYGGRRIRKVLAWRPRWNISMRYAGRGVMEQLMRLVNAMSNQTPVFRTSGIYMPTKFYFRPPGDSTRPKVEVVLEGDSVEADYLAERYMGYRNVTINIVGAETYAKPVLPKLASIVMATADGACLVWGPGFIAPELHS